MHSLVRAKTKVEAERVGKYLIRPLLPLDRLSFFASEGKIRYRYSQAARETETMDYLEFIARVTSHIPDKGQVTQRYYCLYAKAHRGKIRKASLAAFPLRIVEEELRRVPCIPMELSPGRVLYKKENEGMKRLVYIWSLVLGSLLLSAFSPLQDRESDSRKDGLTFAEIQEEARRFYNLDGTHKKPGWKQYRRWEWLARPRLDRLGFFSPALNRIRWEEKRARFSAASGADRAAWASRGPFQGGKIVSDYSNHGSGRLNCVAFNPLDFDIIWVGAPSGGLWKSTDGGQTWTTNTDALPNIGISDILIHPYNPEIMYIALGDHDAGHSLSVGIMKSVDGGETWSMTGLNPPISEMWLISHLIMHPDDPEIIFASTNHGIYKSRNGGRDWEKKADGNFRSLFVSPADSSTWYASRYAWGVYRSRDAGENWTRLTAGLPTSGFSRINLAVSPSHPQILYASYAEDGNDFYTGFGFYGLYRSLDGGETWSLRSDTPNVFGSEIDDTVQNRYSLGHYAQVLAVSPVDPDVVYLGSINLWKSMDGGSSWRFITHQYGLGGVAHVHVDHHDLCFLPGSTRTMFLCNDGGLYRSDDAGTTWADLSRGLAIRQIYRFGLSSHHPDHFIFGSHDCGSEYFTGEWLSVMTGDGMGCFIDPNDPQIIYTSFQNAHLYRSMDGGLSFVNISEEFQQNGCWVTPFVMDPVDSTTLYAALKKVIKSTDRGNTWRAISPDLTGEDISIIEVAPSNPLCLLVSDGRVVFRTRDGGRNWDRLEHVQTTEIVTDIACHPRNPEIIYLTLGGYGEWFGHGWRFGDYTFDAVKILRSEDGGSTWTNVTGAIPEMPVTCVAVDPQSDAVYVGTDLGVFHSIDGRGNWELFEQGLPNVVVTDLSISPDLDAIWASTFGRGMWKSALADTTAKPVVPPPLFFSATKHEDRSLLQKRYIHVLRWGANRNYDPERLGGYRLYVREYNARVLVAELDKNVREFRKVLLNSDPVRYELTAFDQWQNESPALSVTVY